MSTHRTLRRVLGGATLAAAALLGACGGDGGSPSGPDPDPTPQPQPQPQPGPKVVGRAIFGLDCYNHLVLFGSGNPENLVRQVAITGMSAGAAMLGIDFRPGDGKLYGIGSDSRMYTVDTLTGAATAVGAGFVPAVEGEHFGLTFAGDDLRLQSVESNANQAFDPATGGTASADPALAYVAGDPSEGMNPAIAATGALASGEIYGVDATSNALVRMEPATGALTTVGGFGFNVYLCSGMDIDTDGTAYAAMSTDNGSELYTLDLATGAATLLGEIGGAPIHSIALKP
jgi:hypothetical protein